MSEQNERLVKSPDETVNPTEQLLGAPYGMQGADLFTDTTANVGKWYCLVAVIDGVTLSASGTIVNWNEDPGPSAIGATWTTNLPLPTGVPFYGDFTQIQIAGGGASMVLAYRQ